MAKIINGLIYSNDMKTVLGADSDITSAVIEDGVKTIVPNAFAGCEKLEEIELPNFITDIGEDAFSDCPNLMRVKLAPHIWVNAEWFKSLPDGFEIICDPDSVTYCRLQFDPFFRAHVPALARADKKTSNIHGMQSNSAGMLLSMFSDKYADFEYKILGVEEEYCFVIIRLGKNCLYLALRVDTAAWIEMIEKILRILKDNRLNANAQYSLIDKIITNSDENLLFVNMRYEYAKKMVWEGDKNGKFCIFSPSTLFKGDYSAVFNLEIAGCKRIDSFAFQDHEHFQSVAIYEGTKCIETVAFENCTGIETLELPESLELIRNGAFRGCTALESITIPSGVRKIEYSAFENCVSLESLSFKEGVEDIESYAFQNCPELQKVTLPRSLKHLDKEVFADCTSLSEIEYAGTVAEWEKIDKQLFWDCDRHISWNEGCPAMSVKCTDGEVDLSLFVKDGDLLRLFDGGAKSFTIPNYITKVCDGAFISCSLLSEISFDGTLAQWEEIEKEDDWDAGCPCKIVHCTDGDAEL